MRRLLLIALALLLAAGPAAAADPPRLLVLKARGPTAGFPNTLTKNLRKRLASRVGRLFSSEIYFKNAIRVRKQLGRKLGASEIAQVAGDLGVEHVLRISLRKRKRNYQARVRLLGTRSRAYELEFQVEYLPSKSGAAAAAREIAERVGEALSPAPSDEPSTGELEPAEEPDAEAEPEPPRIDEGEPEVVQPELEPEPETSAEGAAKPEDPPMEAILTATPTAPRAAIDRAELRTDVRSATSREWIRVSISGGSNVLRQLDIVSEDGRVSRLSYQLRPLGLVSGQLELRIPASLFGLSFEGAYSPVSFRVQVAEIDDRAAGYLLDLVTSARLYFAVDRARSFELIPVAGLGYARVSVAPNAGSVILGSGSWSPFVGLGMRWTASRRIELGAQLQGGFLLAFSQSPTSDGDGAGGFAFGGSVGLRIWLWHRVGLTAETRFQYERASLSGRSNRQLPQGETLENAHLTTKDLRLSLGALVRFGS